jgi:hypothetical protein
MPDDGTKVLDSPALTRDYADWLDCDGSGDFSSLASCHQRVFLFAMCRQSAELFVLVVLARG